MKKIICLEWSNMPYKHDIILDQDSFRESPPTCARLPPTDLPWLPIDLSWPPMTFSFSVLFICVLLLKISLQEMLIAHATLRLSWFWRTPPCCTWWLRRRLSFTLLVTEFGGTLGLFLGFYFMTLWDVVEFAVGVFPPLLQFLDQLIR